MPLTISTATASFRAADLSEDRLAVHHVEGGIVVVVADGAGGMPGGGRAADFTLRMVQEALARSGFKPFASGPWADLLVEADTFIERDRLAGETTCVVVAVTDEGRVVGASSGDSGAMIVGQDGSTDDLTAGQHRKKRLGSGRAFPVTFERPTLAGTLVTATDGLLAYARPDVIASVVTGHWEDLDEAAAGLLAAVRLPTDAYVDDVALVLIRG